MAVEMRRWEVLLCLALGGCIPSNVVARVDRAVQPTPVPADWRPAHQADIDGFFESVEIQGEAASGIWKIYYLFTPDGRFTGAALGPTDLGPRFQVLAGEWRLDGDQLVLGADGETARTTGTNQHLRLETANGSVVLRRAPLQ